jgi:hypothetical protein
MTDGMSGRRTDKQEHVKARSTLQQNKGAPRRAPRADIIMAKYGTKRTEGPPKAHIHACEEKAGNTCTKWATGWEQAMLIQQGNTRATREPAVS